MRKFEKKMTSLSKLKGVTVHTLQLFCGMQDVSQEEPCSYLLSTTAKQVCKCAWTIYFLIPGASCLNKGQHLLKLCDYFFSASVFARKLFSGVRFRSCCQSIIGADYLISFHLLRLWNSPRAAYVNIHTFHVLYWFRSCVMCARCLQGSSNGKVAWVGGSKMVCSASTLF